MTAGSLELLLLYVLSAMATFAFLMSKARRRNFVFALLAAVAWPVFFIYASIREFTK
jgi:hypothetical protein